MKKLSKKLYSVLPALALMVGVFALNSVCLSAYHQPEISSSLDAYRR